MNGSVLQIRQSNSWIVVLFKTTDGHRCTRIKRCGRNPCSSVSIRGRNFEKRRDLSGPEIVKTLSSQLRWSRKNVKRSLQSRCFIVPDFEWASRTTLERSFYTNRQTPSNEPAIVLAMSLLKRVFPSQPYTNHPGRLRCISISDDRGRTSTGWLRGNRERERGFLRQ